MADPKGFMTTPREEWPRRPVGERVRDWDEVYVPGALLPIISTQADRCMDCGVPFCHDACPLGNLIPEWNDLVSRDDWRAASDRLHATNNFPEFTGRLCPAPCEAGCVLAINQPAVTIKNVEVAIADRAWEDGFAPPRPPDRLSGRTVAVIGSGPTGLAAAQQLTRAGHTVAVYERDDRIGGLMRYGIPAFKMEKRHLDRRLGADAGGGNEVPYVDGGRPGHRGGRAAGALRRGGPRGRRHGLARTARTGAGVERHPCRRWSICRWPTGCARATWRRLPLSAAGKHVVIVGGGDTGADCLGTAVREGAASVTQLDIYRAAGRGARRGRRAVADVPEDLPAVGRARGGRGAGDGARGGRGRAALRGVHAPFHRGRGGPGAGAASRRGRRRRRGPGRARAGTLPADLVLLALGFSGPDRARRPGRPARTGRSSPRGTLTRDARLRDQRCPACTRPGTRPAASHSSCGRSPRAARWRPRWTSWLTGTTRLPAPIGPYDRPMTA